MTDLFLYLHYLHLMRIEDIFPDFKSKRRNSCAFIGWINSSWKQIPVYISQDIILVYIIQVYISHDVLFVTLFLQIYLVHLIWKEGRGTGRVKLSSTYFSLSQKASILTLKIVKKWLSLLLMFKSPSLELEAGSFRLFSLSERQIASFQHTFKFFIYWSSNADRTLRTWSKYLKSGINLLHKVLSKWRNFKTAFIII